MTFTDPATFQHALTGAGKAAGLHERSGLIRDKAIYITHSPIPAGGQKTCPPPQESRDLFSFSCLQGCVHCQLSSQWLENQEMSGNLSAEPPSQDLCGEKSQTFPILLETESRPQECGGSSSTILQLQGAGSGLETVPVILFLKARLENKNIMNGMKIFFIKYFLLQSMHNLWFLDGCLFQFLVW